MALLTDLGYTPCGYSMLIVSEITKIFNSATALSAISFTAQPGELLGLLGRNGAGKSTCLRILSTYLKASSGSVSLAGLDYNTKRKAVAQLVGYVPDHPALYNQLTVAEYLQYIGALRGLKKPELNLAVSRVISECQLAEVNNCLCGHLSRGYRQRVSLAQALIHKPALLLLDEPTIGLDLEQLSTLRQILQSTAHKSIVLFSSHMLSEVTDICTRVLIFESGRIKSDLPLERNQSSESLKIKLQAA